MSPEAAVDPASEQRARWAPWVGLGVALLIVALAVAVPRWFDWQVYSHRLPSPRDVAPLHSRWEPKLGVGTVPAVLIALLGWRYAAAWADRLTWPRLLAGSYVLGLGWLLALAYVDGSSGISRVLGNSYEYLQTARQIDDVPALLGQYVDRIPLDAPDAWDTHVAVHPPGAVLFFVVLARLGLGGDWAAGMVVTVLAATTPLAVMIALRALGVELVARRVAPFLVLGPAAVWSAVSADAMFAAVAAWGLAMLALAATADSRWRMVAWASGAGVLLGYCVMMSYGLPMLGLLALAVLAAGRSWWPLPVAVVTASAVVLVFAAGGFAWWEAFPVLQDRYWAGTAHKRPAAYWMWGNIAALLVSAGPLLGAALARLLVVRRQVERQVLLLVGAATTTVLLADLSQMSKSEVERIWLPFVPWLLISTAVLPPRWRSGGLALQLLTALVVQHLLYTSW
jgi:methylthioxylose transferase